MRVATRPATALVLAAQRGLLPWASRPGSGRRRCRTWSSYWNPVKSWDFQSPGFLLHGPVGVGKTYAMVAALRRAAGRGLTPKFAKAIDYLKLLKATFDGGDPEAKLHARHWLDGLLEVDLLGLDDLGAELDTDWAAAELAQLIEELYGTEVPLVVTSNLSLPEIAARLGERAGSRLVSLATPLFLPGHDRRLRVVEKPRLVEVDKPLGAMVKRSTS